MFDDVFGAAKPEVFKGDYRKADKPKPTKAERTRMKAIAKTLADEAKYRSSLPPDNAGTIPDVRPETIAKLRELGKVLTPSERMTLTLAGRSSADLAEFVPNVTLPEREAPTKEDALKGLINETYGEDKLKGMNDADWMNAMADRAAAQGSLEAIQREANEAKLSSRKAFRDKVFKQLDMMRNDANFSLDDLVKAEFALKQLDDPASCDVGCLAAVTEVNGLVNNHLVEMQGLINAEAAKLESERADLAAMAGNQFETALPEADVPAE